MIKSKIKEATITCTVHIASFDMEKLVKSGNFFRYFENAIKQCSEYEIPFVWNDPVVKIEWEGDKVEQM